MRVKLFFVICLLLFTSQISKAIETGKIEYEVPIDYSYLNESEIKAEAEHYYKQYLETKDEKALQNMLSSYTLLTNINKENPLYFVRVGMAYNKLKKDRYAKSYLYRSMYIINKYPDSFYEFGNFWFERNQYRKALRDYLTSYEYGYSQKYDNLYKIGICHEKMGDYKSAITYFKKALEYNNNEDLLKRIQFLEEKLKANPIYNER